MLMESTCRSRALLAIKSVEADMGSSLEDEHSVLPDSVRSSPNPQPVASTSTASLPLYISPPTLQAAHDSRVQKQVQAGQDFISPLSLILDADAQINHCNASYSESRLFRPKHDKLPKLDPIACGLCSDPEARRLFGL